MMYEKFEGTKSAISCSEGRQFLFKPAMNTSVIYGIKPKELWGHRAGAGRQKLHPVTAEISLSLLQPVTACCSLLQPVAAEITA